ncbi:MAG: thioesterase [Micrococcales bacterium]|nr:thioesterase [Micrococcales bacterium]
MPVSKFQHTVTPADTAASVGSGDLEVLSTPRLMTWCEQASYQVCRVVIEPDRTTVGTLVTFEHVRGSAVGAELTIECAKPINDGRRLVCAVTVKDHDGDEVGRGEFARSVVDPDRFMAKCQPQG